MRRFERHHPPPPEEEDELLLDEKKRRERSAGPTEGYDPNHKAQAAGISNRPAGEEEHEQEKLPPRGHAKREQPPS